MSESDEKKSIDRINPVRFGFGQKRISLNEVGKLKLDKFEHTHAKIFDAFVTKNCKISNEISSSLHETMAII